MGRSAQLLRRITLARAILPAYATAMLAMALSTLVCQFEERYWVPRDHLMEFTAAAPSATRSEYQAAQEMRQELIEILSQPE